MEKTNETSLNNTQENINIIKQLFPLVVNEDKIDFDMLKTILGDVIDTSKEKYQFTWGGKTECIKLAQTVSYATLRPCKNKSKDWDDTKNLYIEGDNLEVLKQLQKTYIGQIKMIYIDPPYNTGGDFVYKDNFVDSISNYVEQTNQAHKSNPETSGRYHADWLSMMYPRLILARNLLATEGVIFISIDDNEYANLKKICDEIFGVDSFVTTIHVELSATQGMKVKAAQNGNIVKNAEYILVYSKDGHKNIAKNILYDYRPDYDGHYSKYLKDDMTLTDVKAVFSKEYPDEKTSNLTDMYSDSVSFRNFVDENVEKIFADDKISGFDVADYPSGKVYKVERSGRSYYIYNNGNKIRQLLPLSASFGYCDDFQKSYGLRKIRGDWWKDFYRDMGNVSKEGDVVFANGKKPVRLISQLIRMCTDNDDTILDFFSGSATTAHATMLVNKETKGNRKFILVQLPEKYEDSDEFDTICDLGEERIRRASAEIESEPEIDSGFKVFCLDSTNINSWDNIHEYNENTIYNSLSIFKLDRTKEDILYEIMLKYGVFDKEVKEIKAQEKTLYKVGENEMIVCLDDEIDNEDIEKICAIKPSVVVFKEDGFKDDNAKINAEYNLKRAGIEKVKCI